MSLVLLLTILGSGLTAPADDDVNLSGDAADFVLLSEADVMITEIMEAGLADAVTKTICSGDIYEAFAIIGDNESIQNL